MRRKVRVQGLSEVWMPEGLVPFIAQQASLKLKVSVMNKF